MLDHLDLIEEDLDSSLNENQKLKELADELKSLGNYEAFLIRWESASKMRKWLKEKHTEISNNIQKQADSERLKIQEEAKLKQEKGDDSKEESKTHTLQQEDSQLIQLTTEEIQRKENDEIDILVNKVCEKTKILLKIATPFAWRDSDKEDSSIILAENESEMKKKNTIANELQRLKNIRESKATILNYENISNADILKSCASSVLSCLQCSVTAEEIKQNLESKFVSALHRWSGLRIMAALTSCYMPEESIISCLNAFCSALRQNKNILAHYSDDLSGMGEYLQHKCRNSFFDIYYNIVKQLKSTTDTKTIEFLLNCLKWRIKASDHEYILRSGVIPTLKDGNGKDDEKMNPIKFSLLTKEKTLAHMVIDIFEFIVLACFTRILGEDEGTEILLKGQDSVYKIKRAGSAVNATQTELLLGSCLEIIFEQLNRYTKLMSSTKKRCRQIITNLLGRESEIESSIRPNHEPSNRQNSSPFNQPIPQPSNSLTSDRTLENNASTSSSIFGRGRENTSPQNSMFRQNNVSPIFSQNRPSPPPEENKQPSLFGGSGSLFGGNNIGDGLFGGSNSPEILENNIQSPFGNRNNAGPLFSNNAAPLFSNNRQSSPPRGSNPRPFGRNAGQPSLFGNNIGTSLFGPGRERAQNQRSNFPTLDFMDQRPSQREEIKQVDAIQHNNKVYDKTVVLKLLRLLEIFTAIAIKSTSINHFVVQVATPAQISALMELALKCQEIQHSKVVFKIISNLTKLSDLHIKINEAFNLIKESSWGKDIFEVNVKANFEGYTFLQYLFNLLVDIRAKQWQQESQFYGAYNTSLVITGILKNIMTTEAPSAWKTALEKVLESFIVDSHRYSIQEREAILSIIEGGEYYGLVYGAHGKTKDNTKLTIFGFDKDLTSSQKNHNIDIEYQNPNHHVLAIHYDETHPERNDIFVAKPEEVTLIPKLINTFSDFLITGSRMTQFITTLDLDQHPDSSDTDTLAK